MVKTPEVVVAEPIIDDATLAGISSFADALALVVDESGTVETMADYGTGFAVLPTDKQMQLVGVGFVIIDWHFNVSSMGRDDLTSKKAVAAIGKEGGTFVSLTIVTESGAKWIVNDGSTGICKQLDDISTRREKKGHKKPYQGLFVKGGLTVSDYEVEDSATGKMKAARTFYLAESA